MCLSVYCLFVFGEIIKSTPLNIETQAIHTLFTKKRKQWGYTLLDANKRINILFWNTISHILFEKAFLLFYFWKSIFVPNLK